MPEEKNSSEPAFSELEKKLGSLRPRGLDDAFESRLLRRMELVDSAQDQQRAMWIRFAPVAGLSLAVLVIAIGVQSHLRQLAGNVDAELPVTAGVSASNHSAETTPAAAPLLPEQVESAAGQFVPVSHQNFLKGAQDAGIIDNGTSIPERRVRLEFEDAWHWHDPETQTNIRVFRPREEVILVPIETN